LRLELVGTERIDIADRMCRRGSRRDRRRQRLLRRDPRLAPRLARHASQSLGLGRRRTERRVPGARLAHQLGQPRRQRRIDWPVVERPFDRHPWIDRLGRARQQRRRRPAGPGAARRGQQQQEEGEDVAHRAWPYSPPAQSATGQGLPPGERPPMSRPCRSRHARP